MQRMAPVAVLLGVITLGGGIGPAAAQLATPGVALVLEIDGPVTPALRAYREIPSGTTVSLGNDSRLIFLHYASCRTLTVVGGSVTFTTGPAPILKGTATRADVRGRCPKKFSAAGSDAAVVFREPSTRAVGMSATPEFILVGRRADDFGAIRIRHGGRELIGRALDGPRFTWPADVPPLVPGAYVLELLPRASGTAPATVTFEVSTRPADAFTLITID
jgi:hypothetical protein